MCEAWVQGVVLPTGLGGWHMSGRPGARVACALRLQGYACTPTGTRAWCAGDTCPGDIGPLCVWLGRGAAQGRRALTKGKAVHHTMHLTNAWTPVMCNFAPEMWGLGGTEGQLQEGWGTPFPLHHKTGHRRLPAHMHVPTALLSCGTPPAATERAGESCDQRHTCNREGGRDGVMLAWRRPPSDHPRAQRHCACSCNISRQQAGTRAPLPMAWGAAGTAALGSVPCLVAAMAGVGACSGGVPWACSRNSC